jgi:hypothetical protein
MYFSTTGVETAIWIPQLVALAVPFFRSMGGISDVFLPNAIKWMLTGVIMLTAAEYVLEFLG